VAFVRAVLPRRPIFVASVLALSLARPVAAAVCVDAHVRSTGLPLNPAVLDAMRSEAAAVWAPYGVLLRWTDRTNPDRCSSIDATVAVQVDHAPQRRSTARPVTLGTTRLSSFPTGPVPIRLDVAALDRLLGSLTAERLGHIVGRQLLAPSDVGRALGRVLAHEVGHVLLAGFGHQRKGLMRATFVPAELVDYRRRAYTLSRAEVARLTERAARRDERSPSASISDD
jgi:hypothetical protein